MKTPFLDKELNRLEIGFRGKQLTEEGIAKRNEFMAIKKALDKPDVSGRSVQLKAYTKWLEIYYGVLLPDEAIKDYEQSL